MHCKYYIPLRWHKIPIGYKVFEFDYEIVGSGFSEKEAFFSLKATSEVVKHWRLFQPRKKKRVVDNGVA